MLIFDTSNYHFRFDITPATYRRKENLIVDIQIPHEGFFFFDLGVTVSDEPKFEILARFLHSYPDEKEKFFPKLVDFFSF